MLNKEQTWVPAHDPMHFDKPPVVGVGPGLAFAQKLADAYPTLNIGLVPCAVGGSGIDVWKPGAYYEQTKSHPYDDALARARKLAELVQRLRTDLNAPNVPFVVGTLGDFIVARNPNAKVINETLQQAPGTIKNTYCVLATGLVHKGDTTHFDTPSARVLGQRYADVFIQKHLVTVKQ